MLVIVGYLLFVFGVSQGRKYYPKMCAFLIFIVGALISGFRSLSYTGDNIAYAQYYVINSAKSLAESWYDVVHQIGKDPFYYFVGNLFSKMGFSYRGWFVFIAIVYMAGFCYIMYKHSDNYFFSILFMISLSYYYFSMTGLRQTLAFGICFFAFEMIYKKKRIMFILLVILASMFHSSALIFLIIYICANIPISCKQWIMTGVALIIAYVTPNFINNVVSRLAWNENIENYANVTSGLSVFGFAIQVSILLFINYFIKNDFENERYYRPLINTMFIGAIIQAFAVNIDNIFRMSMYFSVYGAYAVTSVIERQNGTFKRILYMIIGMVMIMYMLRAGNYKYFSLFGGM